MRVGRWLLRQVSALLLIAAMTAAALPSAQACMINEAFEPDEPFYEHFFDHALVVFRGVPIAYHYPGTNAATVPDYRVEITFRVRETYEGEEKDSWTAVWVTTAFIKPVDLLAFKHEIGDDLVVVLTESSNVTAETFGDLPFVAHQNCGQPGMRSYEVMEPVLRRRGLIK